MLLGDERKVVARRGTGKVEVPGGSVSYQFDGPSRSDTMLVLAPGAGANMHSDFMSFMADSLSDKGLRVCRFNFLYSELGRKSPDRQPLLEATYEAVVGKVTDGWGGRVALGGKSMGGRIASHVAPRCRADRLIFLGYPLHPPGKPESIRDAHLYDLDMPMLFVEGTRDPFCPLRTLEEVRSKIPSCDLVVVDDGDHSFKVRKASGRTTEDAWMQVADEVFVWVTA